MVDASQLISRHPLVGYIGYGPEEDAGCGAGLDKVGSTAFLTDGVWAWSVMLRRMMR